MAVSNNPIEQKIPASAVVDTEYVSSEQHGGIYGKVFRQYFTTALPSSLTTGNTVSKLIDYHINMILVADVARHIGQGWSDDGTDLVLIRLVGTSGNNNLTMASSAGMTIENGWVDYTK